MWLVSRRNGLHQIIQRRRNQLQEGDQVRFKWHQAAQQSAHPDSGSQSR